MKIDNNELAIKQNELDQQGAHEEAFEMKKEFLRQIEESGEDFCSCPEACVHHANCYECVVLHRGHQDHLPYCMWGIVNKKINEISKITEGSFKDYKEE